MADVGAGLGGSGTIVGAGVGASVGGPNGHWNDRHDVDEPAYDTLSPTHSVANRVSHVPSSAQHAPRAAEYVPYRNTNATIQQHDDTDNATKAVQYLYRSRLLCSRSFICRFVRPNVYHIASTEWRPRSTLQRRRKRPVVPQYMKSQPWHTPPTLVSRSS